MSFSTEWINLSTIYLNLRFQYIDMAYKCESPKLIFWLEVTFQKQTVTYHQVWMMSTVFLLYRVFVDLYTKFDYGHCKAVEEMAVRTKQFCPKPHWSRDCMLKTSLNLSNPMDSCADSLMAKSKCCIPLSLCLSMSKQYVLSNVFKVWWKRSKATFYSGWYWDDLYSLTTA